MKQYKIDNGKIGGLIVIFMNSLIVVSPFSFLGILALNYDKYIKYWIDIYTFFILSAIFFVVYEWMFFAFVYPSMMTFMNGQTFKAENPVMERMDIIEEKLDRLLGEK